LDRETPMTAFVSFETLYSNLRPGNFMSLSRIWPTFKLESDIFHTRCKSGVKGINIHGSILSFESLYSKFKLETSMSSFGSGQLLN
jgi:hypothetical protein